MDLFKSLPWIQPWTKAVLARGGGGVLGHITHFLIPFPRPLLSRGSFSQGGCGNGAFGNGVLWRLGSVKISTWSRLAGLAYKSATEDPSFFVQN